MGKRKAGTRLKRACNTLLVTALVCIVGVFGARLAEQSRDGSARAAETPPPNEAAADAESPAQTYTVVVDAGHGGIDGGAVGTKTGVAEAGLNLAVAEALAEALTAEGVTVLMTRTDENALAGTKKADMQARRDIMNTEGVDLVVSVHMNRFKDASVSGPMTFYMEGSAEGQRLAELVVESVCAAVERPARKANPGDYFVVRESPAPSVLVECGFLSNAEEEQLLQTEAYQEKLARGIAEGVMNYLAEAESSGAEAPGAEAPGAEAPGAEAPGAEAHGEEGSGASESPGAALSESGES